MFGWQASLKVHELVPTHFLSHQQYVAGHAEALAMSQIMLTTFTPLPSATDLFRFWL